MYDFSYINLKSYTQRLHWSLTFIAFYTYMPKPSELTEPSTTKEQQRELRNCLGEFATGVTIITTLGPLTNAKSQEPRQKIGITANSFSALSLDPPLILWSLGKKSASLSAFSGYGYFAVNILAQSQQQLALTFSGSSTDRFADIPLGNGHEEGLHGLPLITGSLAHFECKVQSSLDHGDHILFIGIVEKFTKTPVAAIEAPLVFNRGKFASLAQESIVPVSTVDLPAEHQHRFYENYLPYLLARAGNDSASRFHAQLKAYGLNMLSWRVLASLADGQAWTVGDLCKVSLAKQPTVSKLLDRLEAQRLIKRTSDSVDARKVLITLTKTGASKINPVVQQAQGYGESLHGKLSTSELKSLKATLKKLIDT